MVSDVSIIDVRHNTLWFHFLNSNLVTATDIFLFIINFCYVLCLVCNKIIAAHFLSQVEIILFYPVIFKRCFNSSSLPAAPRSLLINLKARVINWRRS